MSNQINNIIEKIGELQDELEQAFEARKKEFGFKIEKHRIKFEKNEIKAQKRFKTLLFTYVFSARFLVALTAPVIYSLIIPFLLLDLFVSLYQLICFPVYGMEKVKRGGYIVFDRHKLGYLNLLEKLNCAYCSYGNGVLAYSVEVASRTESYWCPIKHGRKLSAYHNRYGDFSEFGDAENYIADLKRNMENVQKKVDES